MGDRAVLLRHEVRHVEQSDERHGETGGVSRPKQFLQIGTGLFTVAEESVGIGFQRVAFGRDRALAFTQAAVPGGRSKVFHGSLLLSCSARAGLVRLAVPRLRGSALRFRRDGRSARDGSLSPRWSWRSCAW